jgi:glycosyltransferase involved in cell wall biosynthesis
VSHFQPNFDAGLALREELGIKRDAYVVGLVGRYHPSKDIGTFFSAAKIISHCIQDVHFVLAGQGLSEDNSDIADEVNALGSARVHLLGPRGDLDRIYPAFDVLVLSSVAEAFPNVVGEAMASAVPCAVTDVGDCCEIVGSTGRVSPPSDPNGLAAASLEILSMATDARKALGADARQRIVEHYSIEQSATKFTQMYEELSGVCAA